MAKVLIVEDEPTIAQEIAFNLEDHGFDVIGIANSAEKALKYIEVELPDVAMLDISINGMKSGIELAEIIRDRYNFPFIFLTSFADKDTISKAAHTRPEGYLVKPFKDDDLAPALELALIKGKQRDTNKLPEREFVNSKLATPLTSTEYCMVELIWQGKKNQEMADASFVSINTVKTHINNIYSKFDVNSKPQVITAIRNMK